MQHRILAFAEDPGATNYIAPLIPALRSAGWHVKLAAAGQACLRLPHYGLEFLPCHTSREAVALFEQEKPDAILIGTSENLDTPAHALVATARQGRIVSFGAIDSPANSAHRFRGQSDSPFTHAPDWLMVPDEWTKQTFTDIGFRSDRIAVCGHPIHDSVLTRRRALERETKETVRRRVLPHEWEESRPVYVFLSELSDGLDTGQFSHASNYTLHGRGEATRRTEIVLEEVIDAIKNLMPRPRLILRLHPKQTAADLEQYVPELDYVSKSEPALDLVFAADLVIGMSTSLLFEAALLGRPTLAVLPREIEKEWISAVRAGVIPSVTSRQSLCDFLAAFFTDASNGRGAIGQKIVFDAIAHCLSLMNRILDKPSNMAAKSKD